MKAANDILYQQQITEITGILEEPGLSRDEKLQQICASLAQHFEVFDWVGFYLADPEAGRELVLGPYVGEPTEHTRIPFGRGICGQVAETRETLVVDDVSREDNYLACSLGVKAEIVLPILQNDTFVAELDIDSHQKNGISPWHEEMLQEICNIVTEIF